MKKSLVRRTAPARTLANTNTTVEQWRKLQFKAAARGETIREQLETTATESILIPLPAEFVAIVRQMLASRGIPASALPACLGNALIATDIRDGGAILSEHVFPNLREAHSAAMKTFVAQRWKATLVLRFRRSGRIESELFRSPFFNLNAA